MHNTIQYTVLFTLLAMIQVCFIDRLQVGIYVQPLLYIAFVVVLPMQLSRMATLLLGCMVGVIMDILSGVPGLNTIATTAVAYIRPLLLRSIFGHEEVREGGVPSIHKVSPPKFINYTLSILLIHSLIYFNIDTLSWSMFGYSLIRTIINIAVCLPATYLISSLFASRYSL